MPGDAYPFPTMSTTVPAAVPAAKNPLRSFAQALRAKFGALAEARRSRAAASSIAGLEAYLSQAQDHYHLEMLQRQWDRGQARTFC